VRVVPELTAPGAPALRETTPVRMDLSHSAWSDIFFLAMDAPEAARVLNISIDLGVFGRDAQPEPPITSRVSVLDEPVLRLHSIDLAERVDLTRVEQVFDFGADHLGLLRAAIVAAGVVPPSLDGQTGDLAPLLEQLVGSGRGLSLTTHVRGIPKGSRLAVSTNLLASSISALMRATGQTSALTGPLDEPQRRLVCARAILGEWLGGSGGGWQDSAGLWPGLKLIEGAATSAGDPEFGVSRGRLLPDHRLLGGRDGATDLTARLGSSLILVHGGMAQDVGPVLEMVTERFLLRSRPEWEARRQAGQLFEHILTALTDGDLAALGAATQQNFDGPIRSIIPGATNAYTQDLIDGMRRRFGGDFHGFWMLGGMSGGGMGFLVAPQVHAAAREAAAELLAERSAHWSDGLPFAMAPVVYDFAVNEQGSSAALTHQPPAAPHAPPPLPDAQTSADDLDALLAANGFDAERHERLRSELIAGRLGLAANRLAPSVVIADVEPGDVIDVRAGTRSDASAPGEAALAAGELAVVTLAAGAGSRWSRGAGIAKALAPFAELGGQQRRFLDVHRAKLRRSRRITGAALPHVVTSSWLTHPALSRHLATLPDDDRPLLSQGASIGLRMVPTERDLHFAWRQSARQQLDEQAQKVAESTETALVSWARSVGEASDYRDNTPAQCVHPLGHFDELPNLLRNGTLSALLADHPRLRTLLLHNVDTLGAWPDPGLLAAHRRSGAAFTFEVLRRRVDDRGGGLGRVDGKLRLIESVALPREQDELLLSLYNAMTTWIEIDGLLDLLGLDRNDLGDAERVERAARELAARLPVYTTLKEVKKRFGHGHEDVFPVLQTEQLWSDITTLDDARCAYLLVPNPRGRQLKDPSQVDLWLRDGSAPWVDSLCDW